MYSPEIKPERVAALYQLKIKTGKAMTTLVDEALRQYIARENNKSASFAMSTADAAQNQEGEGKREATGQ